MKPRIKVITSGVSDLEKSLAFYRDGLACVLTTSVANACGKLSASA